jgi:hypothetical protein
MPQQGKEIKKGVCGLQAASSNRERNYKIKNK